MTSNPPGECCDRGHLHTGTPQGALTTFAGIETYITGAPIGSSGCRGVLLFLTDVIGHRFVNAQLLADAFAAHGGFHVLMPDLFAGDSRPPRPLGSDAPSAEPIDEWLKRHTHAHTRPAVDAVLAQLRTAPQPPKLVAVGYCFGAKYVTQLLGEGVLHAGFTAHPSFVLLEELAGVNAPLSIAAAETDDIFTTEQRHETEATLKQAGATYQMTVFSGVVHGFAVRCDLADPWQRWAKEAAFQQALSWFRYHLDA